EWVFQERQRREQGYLTAHERLAALALARGEAAAAEGHLRRAIAADPLRESAQRGLMAALAAQGNYAAALPSHRERRLRLHRELNAQPDPETQAVFQQLRAEAREMAGGATGEGGQRTTSAGKATGRSTSASPPLSLPIAPSPRPSVTPSSAGAPAGGE